jgi:hypothetical protein
MMMTMMMISHDFFTLIFPDELSPLSALCFSFIFLCSLTTRMANLRASLFKAKPADLSKDNVET